MIHHGNLQCDTTSRQQIPQHVITYHDISHHIPGPLTMWFVTPFLRSFRPVSGPIYWCEIIYILEEYHDMSGCVWGHHVVSRCVIMCHGISLYISLMMQASLQPVKSSEGLRKGVRWSSGAWLYQSHPIYEPKADTMIYTRWSLEYTDYL